MSDPYDPQHQPGQPAGGPDGGGGPQYGVPPQAHPDVPPQQAFPPQYGVPPQGLPPQQGAPPTMPYGAPQQAPQGPGFAQDPGGGYPGPGQQFPPGPGYQGEQQFPTQQFPTQGVPGQPYAEQPYPGQPYPGQPYPGQPYAGQSYPGPPGQPYPGQPGQPYAGQPYAQGWGQGDVLQGGRPARRARRWLTVTIAASVVAVLGVAGGAYAVFGRGGSGPSPDHYVPDSAIAMVTVDLEPPAGQTVAALRFARKFPQVAEKSKGDNLVDGLVRSMLEGSDLKDFDNDVRPWLGRNVGVAVLPNDGKEPTPLVVAEVTDKAKAKQGLDHLDEENDGVGYTLVDDVVLISESTEVTEKAAAEAKAHPLDADDQYKHDMDALDDDRVLSGWADLKAMVGSLPEEARGSSGLANTKGRLAFELRFGDNHAEVVAKTFDAVQTSGQAIGDDVGKLPEDTAVAFGVTGLDESISKAIDAMRDSGLDFAISELEDETGLSLPDDITGLLGAKTILTATGDMSDVGLITSADKDTAQATVDKLLEAIGEDAPEVVVHEAGGRTILATSEEYAAALAGGGTLGQQEAFRSAVPDAAGSSAVVYANVQQIFEAIGEEPPSDVKALSAVGLTVKSQGSTATLRLRVVVH